MTIDRDGERLRLLLEPREVKLLRHVLERALFIDTPVDEQEAIMSLASRLLDALPPTP
ncbi:MAG TPA: hypothetical protein VLI67_04365 [Vicinamibacteria bacterium]|nr:hypothetical protein [Vicinamibacteria bacterium]